MNSLKATGLSSPQGLVLVASSSSDSQRSVWDCKAESDSFHFDTAEQLRNVFCILTINSTQLPYVKSKEYNHYSEAVIF